MNNDHYHIIEQYLNGELKGEALGTFEEQLKNDKDLAAELLLYRNIQNEMIGSQRYEENEKALAATLKELGKRHFAPPPKKTATIRRMWHYAAAAAIVIIFFVARAFFNTPATSEQLYAEYAVPEKLSVVQRGADSDSSTIAAANHYNKGAYNAALPYLQTIILRDAGPAQLMLALGICQVQTGSIAAAIRNFDIISQGESIYKYEASFWKALALLKQNKKEDAKKELEQIPVDASAYEKASKLLKEL